MEINSLNNVKVMEIPKESLTAVTSSLANIIYNDKIFICNLSFSINKEVKSNEVIAEIDLPFKVSYRYTSQLTRILGQYDSIKRDPVISLMTFDGKLRLMANDKIEFGNEISLNTFWYVGQLVGLIG